MLSSTVSICPRYVVLNQLGMTLQLRADLLDGRRVTGLLF